MGLVLIVSKQFYHYGLWHWYRYNKTNISELLKKRGEDISLQRVCNFLENLRNMIPNELFKEGQSKRVTEIISELEFPKIRESCRFLEYIEEAKNRKGGTLHSRILLTILEKEPTVLAVEIPVWNHWYFLDGKYQPVVGHIDLLQYIDNKLHIFDLKTNSDKKVDEQVYTYKKLLESLILDLKDVSIGWFNTHYSYLITSYDPKPLFEGMRYPWRVKTKSEKI